MPASITSRRIIGACKEATTLALTARDKRLKFGVKRDKEEDGPDVGAIFLDKNGRELTRGYRHEIKRFHGEVSAIANLFKKGEEWKLDKLYYVVTTLEPCSVRPKNQTFPCVKFLIYYGARFVIIGSFDSAIIVRGRGANLLDSYNIDIATFPDYISKDTVRNNINRLYNIHHKNHALSLREKLESVNSDDHYEALQYLFDNALRDIDNPTIKSSPHEILEKFKIDKGFLKLAKEAKVKMRGKKEAMEYATTFVLNYYQKFDKFLSQKVDFLKPIKLTLREALGIHLMVQKADPKFEDKIYYEIAIYIKETRLSSV